MVGADGTGGKVLTPEIVFARSATLYEMNADGSGVHRLTARRMIDDSPAWRPA